MSAQAVDQIVSGNVRMQRSVGRCANSSNDFGEFFSNRHLENQNGEFVVNCG